MSLFVLVTTEFPAAATASDVHDRTVGYLQSALAPNGSKNAAYSSILLPQDNIRNFGIPVPLPP